MNEEILLYYVWGTELPVKLHYEQGNPAIRYGKFRLESSGSYNYVELNTLAVF